MRLFTLLSTPSALVLTDLTEITNLEEAIPIHIRCERVLEIVTKVGIV